MSTQPKALRLADVLEKEHLHTITVDMEAAAELRRLHISNTELAAALKELLSCPAGDYDTTDDYANACKRAEAAIAKAEA